MPRRQLFQPLDLSKSVLFGPLLRRLFISERWIPCLRSKLIIELLKHSDFDTNTFSNTNHSSVHYSCHRTIRIGLFVSIFSHTLCYPYHPDYLGGHVILLQKPCLSSGSAHAKSDQWCGQKSRFSLSEG